MIRRIIFAIITILGLTMMIAEPLLAADGNTLGPATTNGQQDGAIGNTLQPQGASQGLQNAPVGDNQTAPATSGASLQAGGDLNSAAISNYLSGETSPASAPNTPWTQERVMTYLGVLAAIGFIGAIIWQIKGRPVLRNDSYAQVTDPEAINEILEMAIGELETTPEPEIQPETSAIDELEIMDSDLDSEVVENLNEISEPDTATTPEIEPVDESLVMSEEVIEKPFVPPKSSKKHKHKKRRK